MATDGTKIIDGDFAHDIYSEYFDLYNAGTDIDTIKKKIELFREGVLDDADYEIYITAFALALWETGFLTEEILNEVKKVIEKGAGVKMWREETDEQEAQKRQKELEKFLTKISTPKKNPKKRIQPMDSTDFLFQISNILSCKGNDGNYYALVLIDVVPYKRQCRYIFLPTTYKGPRAPSLEDVTKCDVVGSKMHSGFAPGYVFSIHRIMLDHRDLVKFAGKFSVVGNLNVKDEFKQHGSFGGNLTFDHVSDELKKLTENMQAFKMQRFPVKQIIG